MTKDIKEVVTSMISCYLRNTYTKSSINLDPAIIRNTLNDYEDQDLFNQIFKGEFEDFMRCLFNNKWYDICADKCKVTFGEFTDFMNTPKVQKVLSKFEISWIDCFFAVMNGDKDICDAIYVEINGNSEMVDEKKQYRALRVQENCIEIALNCFQEIYDATDQPRDVIITQIQNWAEEAEKEWEKPSCIENVYGEYLGFIDDFSTKKKEEYLKEWKESCLDTTDKTQDADMAHLLGQKYAKEYTLDGTSRCTYEEVAEAIETAINEFSNNNNNN